MRLIVGISGASGVIYGIRLLQGLKAQADVETHLVISNGGKLNISLETKMPLRQVEALASVMHSDQNLAASIASGSFQTDGMIVAPCSMKTLSGIVTSYADTLIVRAADVVLKEHRRLVLMPCETRCTWATAGCCCRRRKWAPYFADWFETLAKAEKSHAGRFQKALDGLEKL